MNVDKLLVGAGAYFGGDGVNYDRFEPHKFAALVLANTPQQRTWVGLTDGEMNDVYRQSFGLIDSRLVGEQIKFVRSVEAKLKEKNT